MAATLLGGVLVAVLQLLGLADGTQGWVADEFGLHVLIEGVLAVLLIAVPTAAAAAVVGWAGWRRGWLAIVVVAVVVTLALVGAASWRAPSVPVRAPPAVGAPHGPETLVLVTIDTLRRDHVSAYPDALIPGLTPTLEALAADGIRFDAARAPAPLTLPVHTSMLTGRLPMDHGVLRNGMVLDADLAPGLPAVLGERGYRTGAFVSSSVLHGSHGLGRWFHAYRDALGAQPTRERLLLSPLVFGVEDLGKLEKEPGERTVDRALAWLEAQGDAPVFVWVHLYDPHAPHAERPLAGGPEGAYAELPDPCDYAGHPSQRARTSPIV